jgi:hypothetical protein
MQSLKTGFLLSLIAAAISVGGTLAAADKYTGPRPAKVDIPYLLHAANLVETEIGEAKEESRKDGRAYILNGASSQVRTPLAEPIFLIRVEKLNPDKLALYPLEVKNGSREVFFPNRPKKDSVRAVHTIVTRVADGLFRVEANEGLDNGEYALSPDGTNQVFAFQIY